MTFLNNSYSLVVVLALALGNVAGAAPRRVVVANGDCKDAELSSQTKALYDTLVARPGENVLTASDFVERLFPQPSGSFEDIKRQLEAAQGQFYEARYARAAPAIDEVLRQVARLPVGEARWKLYVDALLLQAVNYRAMGRVKESDEAFRGVLRLDAQYELDPNYYTPSTRQAFDRLRRELARAKKVRLSVQSSTLPAAEVFLDGRSMGQTPLTLEVHAGTYELTLKKGAAVSFPHQIPVQGEETPVLVDLAYEGAISASPFPCLASADGEQGLSHAIRLGGTLGVEEVIVVKLEGASSGPKWLAATVLNVEGGQKLREGGFKTRGLDAPAESLNALVDFVTTGKAQPSVVVAQANIQPPWEAPSAEQAGLSEATAKSGSVRPLRVVSYVTLGAGVAALAGTGILRLAIQKDSQALEQGNHLNANGNVNADDRVGREIVNRMAGKVRIHNGLLIGSGAALATGLVLFLLSPAEAPPPVSVGVVAGPNGAGASLSGTF
ncbi:PEGA domain-containing protein [Archangium minus]|uniref:PEGA domain-containing protein n=1 Tax=Archangium minus TaxID=83450 RepID=A0ABY9X7Y3_9BACT|nr:PEGA domain-containing protein [Archangium minus]